MNFVLVVVITTAMGYGDKSVEMQEFTTLERCEEVVKHLSKQEVCTTNRSGRVCYPPFAGTCHKK